MVKELINRLKSKKIVITVFALVILTLLGVAYAWFSYYQESDENNVLIAGDIYMVLDSEMNMLNLSNVVPISAEKARSKTDNIITFTVEGTNTSGKDIYYELQLQEGTAQSGTRFNPDSLAFDLYEVINNEDVLLLDAVSFDDFNNHKIWVDKIPAGTNTEITKTYKLRAWLAEKVGISDTYAGADYTTSEFSNLYATVKVGAEGKITKKDYPLTFVFTPDDFLLTLQDEEAATVGVTITSPNNTLTFTDANNNESTSFTGTYNLVANTPQHVTLGVSNIGQYGTDVNFSITKNNQVVETFTRTVYPGKDKVIGRVTYLNTDGTTLSTQALHKVRNDYVNAFIDSELFVGWSTTNGGSLEYAYGDLINFTEDTTLYPVMTELSVMDTFNNALTRMVMNGQIGMEEAQQVAGAITTINFVKMSDSEIDSAISDANNITIDLTYNNQGRVIGIFNNGILNIASVSPTYLSTGENLFKNMINLTSISFTNAKTSMVTNMSGMFYGCSSLTNLDLRSFNTSNVTDMSGMFFECLYLTNLNLNSFNTGSVTNMSNMFSTCYRLEELFINNFNTSNVTDMSDMFYQCSSMLSLDLTNFNTSSVTNMSNMFRLCTNLIDLDISSFNTANVTNMSYMFSNTALSNLNLSSFDTSSVTDMSKMFNGCQNLRKILASSTLWDISNVTSSDDMFSMCSSLVGGNGTVFDSNYIDKTYAIIDGTNGNPGYLSAT